jgi:hypothetical protein
MSRSKQSSIADKNRFCGVFRYLEFWPRLCIASMCVGCILGPVELVPDNLPPEIINATSFNQCNLNLECIDEDFGSVIRYCQNCDLAADIVASNGLIFAMVEDDAPEAMTSGLRWYSRILWKPTDKHSLCKS